MNRADAGRAPERGAILILTLILMSATVFLGLSYLSASTFRLETQDTALQRLRAQAIAEGAVEVAQQDLIDTGVISSATKQTLGSGTFSFQTTSSGGGYDIVSVGTVEGVQVKCFSRVESLMPQLDLTATLSVDGNLIGNMGANTDFSWGGTLDSSVGVTPTSFDRSAFQYDLLETQTVSLSGQSIRGNLLCQGSLTLLNSCTVDGSVYISGDLTLDGRGTGAMKILSGNSSAVLLVEGNLSITDLADLTIQGSIFVLGNADIRNVARLNVAGSLVVNGNLDFQLDAAAQGMWIYDPAVKDNPPPVVVGGDRARKLTEAWRRFARVE